MLQNFLNKIKSGETKEAIIKIDEHGNIEKTQLFKKLFVSIVIILVASLSFGIGRLSVVEERTPIKIEYDQVLGNKDNKMETASAINFITNTVGKSSDNNLIVVASKNGSKYHYLYCSGAKQIKESNKISFASAQAAEIAGYTLAENCTPRN